MNSKERAKRPGRVPYYGATGQVGCIDESLFNEPLLLLGEDGVQFFDRDKPKAYLVDGPAWVNNHAHVLRVLDNVADRRFLMYQLNWVDYHGHVNGTTRLKLTKSAMTRLPVRLPTIAEQRRIVAILEDHFSRLNAASRLLSAASRRWEALWQSAVEGEITGRRSSMQRQAAVELADEGVDDGSLPPLPVGWAWRRLGALADVVGGVTKDAKRQNDLDSMEVPYLRVANVQRGFLDLATVTTIRVPPATAEKLRLLPGDVLLNEGGDRDKLGRGWVWDGQIDRCIHQNHVFRARVREDAIDSRLLSWAANSIGGRWCERNGRQSVNLASISLSKIKMMPVPVPPRSEQGAIVLRLQTLADAGATLRQELRTAIAREGAIRRSLLSAAFGGHLTRARSGERVVRELARV